MAERLESYREMLQKAADKFDELVTECFEFALKQGDEREIPTHKSISRFINSYCKTAVGAFAENPNSFVGTPFITGAVAKRVLELVKDRADMDEVFTGSTDDDGDKSIRDSVDKVTEG